MFKTLVHKNILEVSASFFRDKKKGGKLSGKAMTGMIVLYVFVFLCLGGSFAAMASLFFLSSEAETTWVAWTIMALLGVAMSTLINALTSYTQLYLARDNETLLSMPIKPSDIVKSRMVSVYLMGMLYLSMVWLPSIIVALVMHKITAIATIISLLMFFVLGFIVLSLTCIIGWIVALIATKFKNKKMMTAAISLLFIGLIYVFQFKSNEIFKNVAMDMVGTGENLKHAFYPLYLIGESVGERGNILAFVATIAVAFVMMAIALALVSKSFRKMATAKQVGKKKEFRQTQIKTSKINYTLYNKEKKRFWNSTNWMLNAGFGALIMLILAAVLFIKADMIMEKINPVIAIVPEFKAYLPIAIASAIVMIESMTCTTVASISMEGKSLWMIQTLPIDPIKLLMSKHKFSCNMQGLPAIAIAVAANYAFKMDNKQFVQLLLFVFIFTYTSAMFGLMMNLKHSRFDWTSESTVIKQGMAVVATLFGGWLFAIVMGGLSFLLRNIISMDYYLYAVSVLMLAGYLLMFRWLKREGYRLLW